MVSGYTVIAFRLLKHIPGVNNELVIVLFIIEMTLQNTRVIFRTYRREKHEEEKAISDASYGLS